MVMKVTACSVYAAQHYRSALGVSWSCVYEDRMCSMTANLATCTAVAFLHRMEHTHVTSTNFDCCAGQSNIP